MTREQALSFCINNNGTLFYWNTSLEQDLLQSLFFSGDERLADKELFQMKCLKLYQNYFVIK